MEDEHGNHPKNIQDMLNFLQFLKEKHNISWPQLSPLKRHQIKPSRIPVAKMNVSSYIEKPPITSTPYKAVSVTK